MVPNRIRGCPIARRLAVKFWRANSFSWPLFSLRGVSKLLGLDCNPRRLFAL